MSGVEHRTGTRKEPATSPVNATHLIAFALSAGGLSPLQQVLRGVPADVPAAVVIVQHIGQHSDLCEILRGRIPMRVKLAEEDEPLCSGTAYVCPPGVHATIRPTRTVGLSGTPAIRLVRPSADWLLESAAASYRRCAIGVILSGRLSDGARGVVWMRRAGAHTIAQTPDSCSFPSMPLAAIRTGCVDEILRPDQIASALRLAIRRHNSGARFQAWAEPFAGSN